MQNLASFAYHKHIRNGLSLFLVVSLMMVALSLTSGAHKALAQNDDDTCTPQTRATDIPASDDLAYLKKNNIPLKALLEVAKIPQTYVTPDDIGAALTKGGMNADAAKAFVKSFDDASHLLDIVDLSPSRLLLAKAYALLDTYLIPHDELGEVAATAQDEAILRAKLARFKLSPSQIEGFLADSRPLVLEARRTGILRFSLTVSLQDALDDVNFDGDFDDVGQALDDPAKLKQLLTDNGVAPEDLQPLLDRIAELKKEGLSVDLMDGWDIRIVAGILEAYGLPVPTINALAAQGGDSNATSACLKAFGLSPDEVQLAWTQLYGYIWDETNTPFITTDDIADYEDSEVSDLMDSYGLTTDADFNAVFDNIDNLPKLKDYLTQKGLSAEQIDNFFADLQGSLFTETIDPAKLPALGQHSATPQATEAK